LAAFARQPGDLRPALDEAAQAFLPAFAPAAQRLVDRLGGGGQAPLQDGEREADRAGALVVLERLGAVELLATYSVTSL
jgi:hypothetical protein